MLDAAEARLLATLWLAGLLAWALLQCLPEWRALRRLRRADAAGVLHVPLLGATLSGLVGLARPHQAHIITRARTHHAYPMRRLEPFSRAWLRGPESVPSISAESTAPPALRVAIEACGTAELQVVWGPAVGAVRALASGGIAGLAAWSGARAEPAAHQHDMDGHGPGRTLAHDALVVERAHVLPSGAGEQAGVVVTELELPVPLQGVTCGAHAACGDLCFCAVSGAAAGRTLCAVVIRRADTRGRSAPQGSRQRTPPPPEQAAEGDVVRGGGGTGDECVSADDDDDGDIDSPLLSDVSVLLIGLRSAVEPAQTASGDDDEGDGGGRWSDAEGGDDGEAEPLVRGPAGLAAGQPAGGPSQRPVTARLLLVAELLVVRPRGSYACADVWGGGGSGGAADGAGDGDCVVCLSAPAVTALLPCRHLCVCATCFEHLSPALCPVCRARFSDYVQMVI